MNLLRARLGAFLETLLLIERGSLRELLPSSVLDDLDTILDDVVGNEQEYYLVRLECEALDPQQLDFRPGAVAANAEIQHLHVAVLGAKQSLPLL